MPIVICEKCKSHISEFSLAADAPLVCASCGTKQCLDIFPAALKEYKKGRQAEKALSEEQSSCFYHQDKVAVVACDACGVYLCDLCDLEVEGRHLCSKCFKNAKDEFSSFQTGAVLHDDIVLAVAALSCFIFYISFLTAPFVIVYSILKWNKIKTPYKKAYKWKFSLAIILALISVNIFVLFIYGVLK